MNTQQLERILREDPRVGPVFHGVFPSDLLPRLKSGAYVINTAPSTQKSGHWVALWITSSRVEFFDSYGRDPSPQLKRKFRQKTWYKNQMVLQSPLSSVCGQYCIYFLLQRSRGVQLEKMLKAFSSNVDRNDTLVYEYIQDQYELTDVQFMNTPGIVQQLARSLIG